MELGPFRSAVDRWLDEHEDALSPDYPGIGTLDQQMLQLAKVRRLAYEAGWMRMGWPELVGGLGGSTLLRAYLGEVLTSRDLVEPGIYSMPEVLAPTVIRYAPPDLTASVVPPLLRGDATWCQGFSEPETGSNLSSLRCRATPRDGHWVITGQKVWTSLAQYARHCFLLVRTGTPDSAHRGITALFVDMESEGITVRPLETMHGVAEFSEVFFDEVVVPFSRTLGEVNGGWAVAMDLLPYERSTSLWHRAAFLHRRLEQLLEKAPPASLEAGRVGEAIELLWAFRARSRTTQRRLAAGEVLGPETSIDKIMLATAEQAVFDLVAQGLASDLIAGDDPASARWRAEFLYSRAATIYGGSVEIQRNIVARRFLDLGRE
jgi:alkylation response protein AidB-like acyl-CoA dehydrogenase